MQELNVTIPVDTINFCLSALGKLPYEVSQPHIELLRSRASAALAAAQQQPELSAAGMD